MNAVDSRLYGLRIGGFCLEIGVRTGLEIELELEYAKATCEQACLSMWLCMISAYGEDTLSVVFSRKSGLEYGFRFRLNLLPE